MIHIARACLLILACAALAACAASSTNAQPEQDDRPTALEETARRIHDVTH